MKEKDVEAYLVWAVEMQGGVTADEAGAADDGDCSCLVDDHLNVSMGWARRPAMRAATLLATLRELMVGGHRPIGRRNAGRIAGGLSAR